MVDATPPPEAAQSESLESPTWLDRWIEGRTRLRIRLKIIGFYVAIQLGLAIGVDFVAGGVCRVITGNGLPILLQFGLTLLTFFAAFSWQALRSPYGYWINGFLVAVVTSAGNLLAYFLGSVATTDPMWPLFLAVLLCTLAFLCIAGFVWRDARKRVLSRPA